MSIETEKGKRPDHSVEPDRDRQDKKSDKHEVDAPAGRADDESDKKTTVRQE